MENIEEHDPALVAQIAFGKRVRDRRLSIGWTQKELAERISDGGVKMHQGTIAKIENGTRPTSIGELSVIAGAFRTTAARLVREDEWEQDELSIYLLLERRRAEFFQSKFQLKVSWREYWERRRELSASLGEAQNYRSNGDVTSPAVNGMFNHAISAARHLLDEDLNVYLSRTNSEFGVSVQYGLDKEAP